MDNCINLEKVLSDHLKWLRGENGGKRADLSGANLSGANLSEANLSEANLSGAINLAAAKNLFFPICCPESGAFIGWKKAFGDGTCSVIVKLQIADDAKRSSATGRKCRCNKAVVLQIESLSGEETYQEARSARDKSFIYKVGQTVSVDDFDENRWSECSTGIHFFITREEAVRYSL